MQIKSQQWSHDISRSARRSGLTDEQVFRLWRAAVKDDGDLVDAVIQKVYDGMIAFNSERAEEVMELTVRRNITARREFRSLLQDMQMPDSPNLPEPHVIVRRLDS